jgi:membrane-associated protease RseP (regulator of RpoE activity)
VVAVAARAQDSVRAGGRPGNRTFTFSMGPEAMRIDMRRGRLGITVDLRPEAARDTIGARVSGVTPGGPADRAGVQTGDIITRINGTPLVAGGSNSEDEQSRPGMRLINLTSRIEAGDTVRLDLRRDNRTVSVSFQADRTDMDQLVERMRIPGNGTTFMRSFGNDRMPFMDGPTSGTMRMMVSGSGLGDLEMVTVTPQLAQGLGITEGLLVTSIDSASTLGLQAGDVITAIAGRRPTSPVHAMRILSSYDAGESVSFDVMRRGRRTTVNGRVPEARHREWRISPNSFDGDLEGLMDRLPMMGRSLERMPDMERMMDELPRFQEMMRERDRMPRRPLLIFEGKV